MSILHKIDLFRRAAMNRITRNIGTSSSLEDFDGKQKPEIKRILLIRPNHRLGNLLLMTPVIQDISETFPDCTVDLFIRGNLAPVLFENYHKIGRVVRLPRKPFNQLGKYIWSWASLKGRNYDLVINLEKNSSSGRLSTQFANAKFRVFGDLDQQTIEQKEDHMHMAKIPVYTFRNALAKLGYEQKSAPVPNLNLKLDSTEIGKGKKTVKELVKNEKPTISIFTNATGRKCYSEEWWHTMYERLLQEFPDYNIVEVLPADNTSKINFKAPAFFSMEVREIGAFIANTVLFIGADSGIMHLSAAVGTTTVGLFSETDPRRYGPYGNKSFSINTDSGGPDEWIDSIKRVL